MAPIVQSQQPVIEFGEPAVGFAAEDKPSAASQTWGNTMPLALVAFAVTTLMLSLINAGLFNAATLPVVLGVGFAVGGVTQLIAGLLQFRIGDTFHGVLFSTFGAFWVALYYYLEFYAKQVPAAQAGHALALMLIAFGILAALLLAASFRTSMVTVLGLSLLTATLFVLAIGKYSASATTVKAGGWLGIVLAGVAFYLALAAVGQASYGREILWVGHLAKK
jgi:succinate-acetate transporter protein